MSQHHFGLHDGHYSRAQVRIADQVEAEFSRDRVEHTNYTEPDGTKRGWWACRNRGEPFDHQTASAVLDRFRKLGGDA